jgi:hypothetical protein
MKMFLLTFGLLLPSFSLMSQGLLQTVRGEVVDQETHFPLPGGTVILMSDSSSSTGMTTNELAGFGFEDVPVGRYQLKISFIGYKDSFVDNVVVTSAKEVMVTILLKEAVIALGEVTVTSGRDGDPSNEMALGSSGSFTVEETQRYAGSRSDPARMAQILPAFRARMMIQEMILWSGEIHRKVCPKQFFD